MSSEVTRLKLWRAAIKRAMDVTGAVTCLGVALPVMVGVGAAIRLDSPGPVFFRQPRLGRNGRVFRIIKFRTMAVDASVIIDGDGSVRNDVHDARHTRIGRYLRAHSIDELPQLVNVLLGHMSLVGPRPDLPGALLVYQGEEALKLKVRPGITGLAQVSGRNALRPREKWMMDVKYVKHFSIRQDLRIALLTLMKVAGRADIYRQTRSASE